MRDDIQFIPHGAIELAGGLPDQPKENDTLKGTRYFLNLEKFT
ncbi:hypothetical protein CLV31_102280 [Algoriphagus aquaeductus]|uniref:Uncharacterized protein n=1 Tax=Algoriphagus aquaeductus TaxID=475299 RepID=A0A326RWD7_9BACT|nr:hypothetical protein [Algoriphagus aquaeductus]PZV86380.1 hypothetical protein CLV31_102280 [Algoriphagus aquaeductus]